MQGVYKGGPRSSRPSSSRERRRDAIKLYLQNDQRMLRVRQVKVQFCRIGSHLGQKDGGNSTQSNVWVRTHRYSFGYIGRYGPQRDVRFPHKFPLMYPENLLGIRVGTLLVGTGAAIVCRPVYDCSSSIFTCKHWV